MYRNFTSESVSEGHPDKIADHIADRVLDACFEKDPYSRVACEVFITGGLVIVGGEISADAFVDVREVVRETLSTVESNDPSYGNIVDSIGVLSAIQNQSKDIADSVIDAQSKKVKGAGDQGMMFGYACNETDVLMPAPIWWANQVMKQAAAVRKSGQCTWMRADAKCQLSVQYEDGRPVGITHVVLSHQHHEGISQKQIREDCIIHVLRPVLGDMLREDTTIQVNPSGSFIIGGPRGDTGLTGRKTMVDTYGGMAHHGGGAFSGKDPSKVDRSAAYLARNIAKTVVSADLARRCEVQLSYAIGVAEPVAVGVDAFGTGVVPNAVLESAIRRVVDCTPEGIIERFTLRTQKYHPTATYGHFGHSDYPWEQIDPSVQQALKTEVQNSA